VSDFSLLSPGQALDGIPSRAWNSFLDAAEFVRDARNQQIAGALGFSRASGVLRVKNSSGGDLNRFSVCAPSGIVFTQTDSAAGFYEEPVLTVTTPAAADQLRGWCVLQEPIKSGLIGQAMFIGLTACQIDVVDSGDDFADSIASDSAKLQSGPFGSASILYKESGTGTKWAVVCIGTPGVPLLIGKTNAAHNKGASGTINVFRGTTAGSETHAGTKTVTAWNHFGNIAITKYVVCAYLQRTWRIIAAECA
jgi:hypothetical protein